MVAITLGKGQTFGIEGYNLPVFEHKQQKNIWKIGNTKRKNFAEE
jgi:hypothetical protein